MRKSISKMWLGSIMILMMAEASADPFALPKFESFRTAEYQSAPENKFLPGKPRARVGEKKAASRAKRAFPDSKILSVNYVQGDGSYRVKLLSSGGVVKYVFVGANGEVFE